MFGVVSMTQPARMKTASMSRMMILGSSKVPDALLKIGYSNYGLQRWDAARGALGRVQADYPDTTAARLAEQRLKRMDDEGQ